MLHRSAGRAIVLDLESFLPAQTPPTNRVQASSRPPVRCAPESNCETFTTTSARSLLQLWRVGSIRIQRSRKNSATQRWTAIDVLYVHRSPVYEKLQHLQFHLSTAHVKYNFSIQNRRRNQLTEKLSRIHIKVENIVRPAVKKEERTEQLAWVAPAPPFDLEKFVSGDHSWTNGAANVIVSEEDSNFRLRVSQRRPSIPHTQAKKAESHQP